MTKGMHKVEYLDKDGDWIFYGWYKNLENAEINAETKSDCGLKTRIIRKGMIIRVYEPKEENIIIRTTN